MKAKSVPVRTLDTEIVSKLAFRALVPPEEIASKHVLFLVDQPNSGSHTPEYSDRQITMAIITDKPVSFDYCATGSTIKSPDDKPDLDRGVTISLARAVRKL